MMPGPPTFWMKQHPAFYGQTGKCPLTRGVLRPYMWAFGNRLHVRISSPSDKENVNAGGCQVQEWMTGSGGLPASEGVLFLNRWLFERLFVLGEWVRRLP